MAIHFSSLHSVLSVFSVSGVVVCLVRSALETFLDVVNNQKDGRKRVQAKDGGILVCHVTGTSHHRCGNLNRHKTGLSLYGVELLCNRRLYLQ